MILYSLSLMIHGFQNQVEKFFGPVQAQSFFGLGSAALMAEHGLRIFRKGSKSLCPTTCRDHTIYRWLYDGVSGDGVSAKLTCKYR